MKLGRGKAVAVTTIILGLAAFAAAGFAFRGRIVEQYYAWKIKKLFDGYAGARDERAMERILSMGDNAVPFLVGVILAREPHLRKFVTIDGPQEVMGTWSQEAASLLFRINTSVVVSEALKLAIHEDEEVRFWGIWVLKICRTEPEKRAAFLRGRVEAETGRNRQEIIEFLAKQRDPDDLTLFRRLVTGEKDLHVRLALLYGLAQQGDREALLEIVKICEAGSGHLGVVYLRNVTGKDFGWKMNLWRQWIENTGRTRTEAVRP
jgi:hypothetical protein